MLIGSYLGIVGEKRRVSLPKKFLKELGKNPIIAKWYEGCLILVGSDFWERLSLRLMGKDRIVTLGVREIERFILGSAFETEPDDQGRIVIPETLYEYALLGKEVIFVGLADRVEIWPRTNWEEKSKDLAETTKVLIEDISKK